MKKGGEDEDDDEEGMREEGGGRREEGGGRRVRTRSASRLKPPLGPACAFCVNICTVVLVLLVKQVN
jgi:hypothetical protein